ncbi:Testis-specific serine/threonine-protein kinase 4 [Vanrija pseudolonga]|uniref:Testis-specific serine/threonine-protein kinase 4 n=1 Tax=Vanrija pseudolonga TaxID=143232 RepID=A0AAF0YMB2_9TREE|nr:Testis-specific serine/threonine-protein kinase 4 [Vanrija pseudolonga]
MLQGSQSNQSPSASPAAAFLRSLGGGGSVSGPTPHPRSFSVSSAPDAEHDAGAPATDLRRARSMKTPATRAFDGMAGLSSFTAAGSGLASSPSSETADAVPALPAIARHPLFAHYAQMPAPPSAASLENPFSPISSDGQDEDMPPSPVESALSSGAFSPASAFLSHFSSRSSMAAVEKITPDAQGARVLNYTLGKIIGRGGFSTVRQAIHVETGEIFACKIVKRDDLSDESGSVERFEDEIRIWKSMPGHPALLPLLEMHRTSFATFLVMPYLSGGSLLDVLRLEGGGENTARKWFPGVVAGVAAMHEGFQDFEGSMLHGDLKLDNFIVDQNGAVKLGDFGMAQKIVPGGQPVATIPPSLSPQAHLPGHLQPRPRMSSAPTPMPVPGSQAYHEQHNKHHQHHHHHHHHHHHSHHRHHDEEEELVPHPSQPFPSASLPYAPPELLRAPPSQPTLAQDIWSTGIILHALLVGRLPFVDSFDPRLQMKILRGQFDEPTFVGQEWLEVLHGTMDRNPATRWDIKRVRESDAVVGWREVKTRLKSRSRSRARHRLSGHESGLDLGIRERSNERHQHPDGIPIPMGRRGRSRSRLAADSMGHHRGSSFPRVASAEFYTAEIERPNSLLERPTSLHIVTQPIDHERSRSASRNRAPGTPGSARPVLSLNTDNLLTPHLATKNGTSSPDDKLVSDLEGVQITRGRSTQRGGNGAVGRSPSASSLFVPDLTLVTGRPTNRSPSVGRQPGMEDVRPSRSRTRWSDVAAGSGPPSASLPSSRSGSNQRGSPGWQANTNDSTPTSRPPTLGFELEAVDEEERGRRGRSPATRGRQPQVFARSKSRGPKQPE